MRDQAIYNTHPSATTIRNGEVFDANDDPVTLDESAISTEQTRLESRQAILDEINALESQVTNRRLREATLTSEGKAWLTNLEALIQVERDKL